MMSLFLDRPPDERCVQRPVPQGCLNSAQARRDRLFQANVTPLSAKTCSHQPLLENLQGAVVGRREHWTGSACRPSNGKGVVPVEVGVRPVQSDVHELVIHFSKRSRTLR